MWSPKSCFQISKGQLPGVIEMFKLYLRMAVGGLGFGILGIRSISLFDL